MFDHGNATSKIFDRVHRTGEEIKNDLPNWVERAVENNTWKRTINPSTGEPFASVGEWLVASWPLGPGMGQGKHAITYDEFILLCENRPRLKKLLVESRPKRREGRPSKDEPETADNIRSFGKDTGSTSRARIEDRLAREFPQHWNDYIDGKYRSARQAAIAAGFLKDSHNPIDRLMSNWRKASKKQRKQFVDMLNANDKAQVTRWINTAVTEANNG
jgi:hypothetical protein